MPLLIKDDGTARGFTQILLTYTLSTITALLGLSTLWLACGTLARDIEECQMQVVAVKPIARWQIWLGKWLGIVSLNAALLALSGASVYGLLQWRAHAAAAGAADRSCATKSWSPAAPPGKPTARPGHRGGDRPAAAGAAGEDAGRPRPTSPKCGAQIREQVKAEFQVVPPGYSAVWEIDLGVAPALAARPAAVPAGQVQRRRDQPLAAPSPALWQVGVPHEDASSGAANR